eukprot:4148093-Amphidinium_carterae.1
MYCLFGGRKGVRGLWSPNRKPKDALPPDQNNLSSLMKTIVVTLGMASVLVSDFGVGRRRGFQMSEVVASHCATQTGPNRPKLFKCL